MACTWKVEPCLSQQCFPPGCVQWLWAQHWGVDDFELTPQEREQSPIWPISPAHVCVVLDACRWMPQHESWALTALGTVFFFIALWFSFLNYEVGLPMLCNTRGCQNIDSNWSVENVFLDVILSHFPEIKDNKETLPGILKWWYLCVIS